VGDDVVHEFAVAEDAFAADAEEGESRVPDGGSCFAEADFNGRVSVSVAVEEPFEAEVEEGGVFDVEATGAGGVLSLEGAGGKEEEGG